MSDVVLIEWFNAHYYRVTLPLGGMRFIPSVTTKLGIIDKPQLSRWRGDIGNREADSRMYEAAEKGTRIHWAYAVSLQSGAVVYNPWQKPIYTEEGIQELKAKHKAIAILRTQEEMWAICKLAEQFKRLKPQVIAVEKTVYDLEANDAGTIDSIFWIDEGDYFVSGQKPLHLLPGIYICDLKTGNYVDDGVWYQLAPYTFMFEKMFGVLVQGALVTHTGSTLKTGIPGLKTMFRSRDMLLNTDYPVFRHASAIWEAKHQEEQPETFEFPSVVTLDVKKEAVCVIPSVPSSPLVASLPQAQVPVPSDR